MLKGFGAKPGIFGPNLLGVFDIDLLFIFFVVVLNLV